MERGFVDGELTCLRHSLMAGRWSNQSISSFLVDGDSGVYIWLASTVVSLYYLLNIVLFFEVYMDK